MVSLLGASSLLSYNQELVVKVSFSSLSLSLFYLRVGHGFFFPFSSTDIQELDMFFISFFSIISPRVGRKDKKRDWISYSSSSDLLFSLEKRKRKKIILDLIFWSPHGSLNFFEKKIKRDKRFDNPKSDLCKRASTPIRSKSPDQISFVWIPIEFEHLYGFKRFLKISIDHRIVASMDYEDIHRSSNHCEDLST